MTIDHISEGPMDTRRVCWDEIGGAGQTVTRMLSVPSVIAQQKATYPGRPYTDQDALQDFCIIHGAWIEHEHDV